MSFFHLAKYVMTSSRGEGSEIFFYPYFGWGQTKYCLDQISCQKHLPIKSYGGGGGERGADSAPHENYDQKQPMRNRVNSNIAHLIFDLCLFVFKNIKMFQLNLKFSAVENNSMVKIRKKRCFFRPQQKIMFLIRQLAK